MGKTLPKRMKKWKPDVMPARRPPDFRPSTEVVGPEPDFKGLKGELTAALEIVALAQEWRQAQQKEPLDSKTRRLCEALDEWAERVKRI